jgi:hypothetical protein
VTSICSFDVWMTTRPHCVQALLGNFFFQCGALIGGPGEGALGGVNFRIRHA